jgi:4-amino-4-deoxy-L-arabinose transferase-like glycosyltransferase
MPDAAACTATPSPAPAADWLIRRPALLLLLVSLLAWLPGLLILPPLDRDESRFAEASRQMVESGDYVDIRFADAPRYNKPVGIYWLQAASTTLWGPKERGRIGVYRLPSFLGGYLALLLLYRCARSVASARTALFASLLLGTSLLLTAESDIATTDAVLLAAVVAAQTALLQIYLAARDARRDRPGRMAVLAGWAALAVGVLIKGPVILGVLGVTALALSLWDRDWRWLGGTRPLLGSAFAAALVAPWAIAIGLASHGAFYQQSLGHDFAAKIMGGQESHGAPPGYYLVLASLTFWPATLLLLPALAGAFARRSESATRFLLAWSGAVWLMFEFVPTKLPHYILPAYPALALLAALWIVAPMDDDQRPWQRMLRHVAGAQFALGALLVAALCAYLPSRFGTTSPWPVFIGLIPCAAAACAAIVLFSRRRRGKAALLAMISAVGFDLVLAFGVAPGLRDLWLSPRAAQLVAEHRTADDPSVLLAGYVEPSLVFLLRGDVDIEQFGSAGRAAAGRGGLALVERRAGAAFLAGLTSAGGAVRPLGDVSGFDYSTGREQQITLYRVTRSPLATAPSGK